MANTAFEHSPTITVPGSGNSTDNAVVLWNGTTGNNFSNSTIIVGATTMGLAADTDLLTFGNGTLAITGTVTGVTALTASGAVTGGTLAGTVSTATQNSITTMTGLTTVGTVGTGIWNGTAVITTYGGTGLASYTAGDMFYYASGTTLTKLAKGTADQVLTMNDGATAPGWEDAAGGGTTVNGDTDNGIISWITSSNEFQVEAGFTYSGTAMLVALAGSPPTPDHVSMHIWEGDAGSVTASTDTQLIIEHSGNAGITILTPNSGTAQLSFGCPAENRQGSIFYDQSANMMTLRSGNDNLKRITLSGSSGDATIYSNLVIGTAGKGIDFSATANSSGSMASELLDDYEEGTWTPSVRDGAGNTAVLDIAGARYTKVGRLVHIQARVRVQSAGTISSSTQTLYIHGLPFNAQNSVSDLQSSFAVGLLGGSSVTAGHDVAALIEQNGSTLVLLINDTTTGMSNLQWGQSGIGFHFSCAGSYTV